MTQRSALMSVGLSWVQISSSKWWIHKAALFREVDWLGCGFHHIQGPNLELHRAVCSAVHSQSFFLCTSIPKGMDVFLSLASIPLGIDALWMYDWLNEYIPLGIYEWRKEYMNNTVTNSMSILWVTFQRKGIPLGIPKRKVSLYRQQLSKYNWKPCCRDAERCWEI